jgi:predicted nucleic acid-binding protein
MKVVSNSSPLIVLYKCDMLPLLDKFFGQIIIPEAVRQEVIHNTKDLQQRKAIASCTFIRTQKLPQEDISFSHKLDRAEAEALFLASTIKANYVLLDDKRAQKEAKLLGINYIPTFALLIKAAQSGIIRDIEMVLSKLQEKHIFLNRDLDLAAKEFLNRRG